MQVSYFLIITVVRTVAEGADYDKSVSTKDIGAEE
jgi:hypothetical protein